MHIQGYRDENSGVDDDICSRDVDDEDDKFGVDPELQGQLAGRFLDGSSAVNLLVSKKCGLKSVHLGVKENVFFILDNTRTFEDRAKSRLVAVVIQITWWIRYFS